MIPRIDEVNDIRFSAPEFYQIGDCSTPANIMEATKTGYYAALNINRY